MAKECKSCGESFPLSGFYKSKAGALGRLAICKGCWQDRHWGKNLKRLYGITPDDYSRMFADQDGCCKICGAHQSSQKRRLYVDHCHETGKVRGLLCHRCNTSISNFECSPELLLRAYEYLKED